MGNRYPRFLDIVKLMFSIIQEILKGQVIFVISSTHVHCLYLLWSDTIQTILLCIKHMLTVIHQYMVYKQTCSFRRKQWLHSFHLRTGNIPEEPYITISTNYKTREQTYYKTRRSDSDIINTTCARLFCDSETFNSESHENLHDVWDSIGLPLKCLEYINMAHLVTGI